MADYRFYEKIGGKDEVKTIAYLANLISRVNDIYQNTVWRDYPQQVRVSFWANWNFDELDQK